MLSCRLRTGGLEDDGHGDHYGRDHHNSDGHDDHDYDGGDGDDHFVSATNAVLSSSYRWGGG